MNGKGAVVLLSGGMDSTFCLYWARQQYERVWCVFVDYGQRNLVHEQLAAHRSAAKAEVPLSIYSMRISWNVTLCQLSRPLRAGLDEEGISNAFVPGRNLHLLTIAAAHTRETYVQADTLVIGCCKNDAQAFPDCRPDFLRAAGTVLSLAFAKPLRVSAPAVGLTKTEMLLAADPHVIAAMQDTWSCYTPTPEGSPCNECDACTHRNTAFNARQSA